jgi:hypothetical protein
MVIAVVCDPVILAIPLRQIEALATVLFTDRRNTI